jgi:hypothetical protein
VHVINPTHPCGAFNNGIKNRLDVRGRAADDAEYFGRRGLLLQGFGELTVTPLEFLKQSHVLNGDNCLIGERFYQLDFSVVKRFDNVAPNRKDSYRGIFPQERHRERRSSAGLSRHRVTFHLGIQIMDRLSL